MALNQIEVTMLNGESFAVELDEGASVVQAMRQIETQLEIPPLTYRLLHEGCVLRIQDTTVPLGACLTLVRDDAWTDTALGLEDQRRKLQEDLAKNEAAHMQQARGEKLRRKRELEAWQRKDT